MGPREPPLGKSPLPRLQCRWRNAALALLLAAHPGDASPGGTYVLQGWLKADIRAETKPGAISVPGPRLGCLAQRHWRAGFTTRLRGRLKDPAFFAAMEAHLASYPEWIPILHPKQTSEAR